MIADLANFRVFYANKTSVETLRTLEHLLPIKADELVGTCIDVFHKDPAHQRRLLSDPSNLPYTAQIQVGDEYLDLLVTAQRNDAGDYIGAVLTWSVVTDRVNAEFDNLRQSQMIDSMPINVLFMEPEEFTITYVNNTSLNTLKTIEHLLPCKADDVLGQCVDIFHKDPAHQRRLLSDPNNLPHKATIEVGPEKLDLNVNAVRDKDGKYIGAMVAWSVATERLRVEAESQRQSQMIDQMPINVMFMEPENFTITYVNNTSKKTLKTIESLLPCKADDIVGQCVDIFHKDPAHQRKLLSDPNNLPHKATIAVGDEKLSLDVTAVTDAGGRYLGAMVAWAVVTDQLRLANNVNEVVGQVASAATEMESTSSAMATTAEQASNQAGAVAAATEELSASVSEISQQVARSASIAAEAVSEARKSNERVQGLATAAEKIGMVVNLINDIAGQTNLLALNATIEAARAGDAGKGFAVVASEVKNLAGQTAKATEDIGNQVAAIQGATRETVAAIQGIGKTIEEINEIANSISAAVEEQSAATSEVATNIAGVTQASDQTGQAASEVLDAAKLLAEQSERLRGEVEQFIKNVGG